MHKPASHRVDWSEYWGRYQIKTIQGRITRWRGIILDTWEWFAWLQEIPSFHFQAKDSGHFTARPASWRGRLTLKRKNPYTYAAKR